MKVYYWADGTWTYEEEYYEGAWGWKSDDFGVLEVLDTLTEDQIYEVVRSKL